MKLVIKLSARHSWDGLTFHLWGGFFFLREGRMECEGQVVTHFRMCYFTFLLLGK